jgi:ubiquinone/menaquinone biosynthesis C-methylase UbiE
MPTSEEVKAYFNQVAPKWDTMRQDYYGEEVIDKALVAAKITGKVPTLVDVGCGTGFLSAGIAPFAEKVIAIDDSEGMLEVARENTAKLGLDNVVTRQGSVSNLPVEGDTAEAAFANMVLHHAPNPQVMINEMARIVKPGGKVVITDIDKHDKEWFKTEMADVWLGFTKGQIRQFMRSAGLTDFQFGWVGKQ